MGKVHTKGTIRAADLILRTLSNLLSHSFTWEHQISSPWLWSLTTTPHQSVVHTHIMFSHIVDNKSTGSDVQWWCLVYSRFVSDHIINLIVLIPRDVQVTISSSWTCEHSTEWNSSTCISWMSDDVRSRYYKKCLDFMHIATTK